MGVPDKEVCVRPPNKRGPQTNLKSLRNEKACEVQKGLLLVLLGVSVGRGRPTGEAGN